MPNPEDFKLPPNSIESEKAVLCSILIDNDCMYSTEGYAIIPKDFYAKEHQIIFDAMQDLFSRRKTIDVITLSNQLTKKGELDNIGGIQYLYEISMFLPTASGIKEYAKIVKEKAILREILKTAQTIIGDVYDEKNVEDILETIEKKIMALTQFQLADSLVHIKDILSGRYEDYFRLSENPDIITEKNTHTGYEDLDKISGGFKPKELIILAARPAMGKTSFALNLAQNAAIKYNKKIAIFSLEMGKEQIADRLISIVSGVPMNKITKGDLSEEDFASIGIALEKLGGVDIYIDDKGGSTVQEIKSKLRKIKIEKGGLDLVIVDYLQLMRGTSKFVGNKVQEIGEISRGLKELSRELDVPILALSQLSRAVENRPDKRPHLSDLRESGAIEQDADMVLMLYRDEYYDPDTDKKGIADLFVRKNRNGPTATIHLYFQKNIMKFTSVEKNLEFDE